MDMEESGEGEQEGDFDLGVEEVNGTGAEGPHREAIGINRL